MMLCTRSNTWASKNMHFGAKVRWVSNRVDGVVSVYCIITTICCRLTVSNNSLIYPRHWLHKARVRIQYRYVIIITRRARCISHANNRKQKAPRKLVSSGALRAYRIIVIIPVFHVPREYFGKNAILVLCPSPPIVLKAETALWLRISEMLEHIRRVETEFFPKQ